MQPLGNGRDVIGFHSGVPALQTAYVSVDHREKLDRIQLLALVFRLHMEKVAADTYRLTGTDPFTVSCEDVREMAICHLVIPVADDLVGTVHTVRADP